MTPEQPDSERPDSAGPTEKAPKSFGLRIAFYIFVVYVCFIAGTSLLLYLLEGPEKLRELWNAQPEGEPPVLPWLLGIKAQIFLAPVILAVTGVFAAADQRTLRDLGVAWPGARVIGPVAQTVGAIALAGVIMGGWWLLAQQFVTFTVAEAFPADQVEAMGHWLPLKTTGLLLFAAGFLVMGFTDEIIFRGYVYSVLRDRLPWIHAAGLSGLLFALFHPGDPAVLAPSLLNLFLIGLLAAGLREGSGSLILGSLLNATWNLLLGCILSLPISGQQVPRLRQLEVEGPLWATGGDFGPEGSWILTGFLLVAVLAVTAWVESGAKSEIEDEPEESSAAG